MASGLDGLRNRWEQISEREQRLVVALGITFVIVIVIWVGLQINERLTALEEENTKTRKALAALQVYRIEGADAQAQNDMPEIPDTPVGLDTYLSGIANEVEIKIPNFNPLTPQSDDDFTQTATQIEIRNLTIEQLKDFLQKVESKSDVVIIRKLNIKQHFRDKAKLDIRMEVATFAKVEPNEADEADQEG